MTQSKEDDNKLASLFYNAITDSSSRLFLVEKSELKRLLSSKKKFITVLSDNASNINDMNLLTFVQSHGYFTNAKSRKRFWDEIYAKIKKQSPGSTKNNRQLEDDEQIKPLDKQVEATTSIWNKTPPRGGVEAQVDLVFLKYLIRNKHVSQQFIKANNKLAAMLFVDTYSRKIDVHLLPKGSKGSGGVVQILNKYIKKEPDLKQIESDQGSEFKNKHVEQWAGDNDVHWRFSKGKRKAFLAEQAVAKFKKALNRTVKNAVQEGEKFNITALAKSIQQATQIANRTESTVTGLSPNDLHLITSSKYENSTDKNKELYLKYAQFVVENKRDSRARSANRYLSSKGKKALDRFIKRNHGKKDLKPNDRVRIKNSILEGTTLQAFANKGSERKRNWTETVYKVLYRRKNDGEDKGNFLYTVGTVDGKNVIQSQFYRQELLYVKQ